METYRFEIPGSLRNLNDFIYANRRNKFEGHTMKRLEQDRVCAAIREQLPGVRINKPVFIRYLWVEKDRRRDLDNITGFGHKVIQDALVECGVIQDDGWAYVTGFSDAFRVSKEEPKIIVGLEVD